MIVFPLDSVLHSLNQVWEQLLGSNSRQADALLDQGFKDSSLLWLLSACADLSLMALYGGHQHTRHSFCMQDDKYQAPG